MGYTIVEVGIKYADFTPNSRCIIPLNDKKHADLTSWSSPLLIMVG